MTRSYMTARKHVNSTPDQEESRRYFLGLWRDEIADARHYRERGNYRMARYWLFYSMDARRRLVEAGMFNGPHKPRVHQRRAKEWGELV